MSRQVGHKFSAVPIERGRQMGQVPGVEKGVDVATGDPPDIV